MDAMVVDLKKIYETIVQKNNIPNVKIDKESSILDRLQIL